MEKNQFLRHLGEFSLQLIQCNLMSDASSPEDLLTDSDVLNLDSYHGAVKKRKLEYRNLTYIPEMTEVRTFNISSVA